MILKFKFISKTFLLPRVFSWEKKCQKTKQRKPLETLDQHVLQHPARLVLRGVGRRPAG